MLAHALVGFVALAGASPLEGLWQRLSAGNPSPRPGEWATYRAASDSGLIFYVRIAAVAEEPVTHGLWMELEAGLSEKMQAPLLRLTFLCERKGRTLTGNIRRATATIAHEPPTALTASALTLEALPGQGRVDAGFQFRVGKEESLMTHAGTVPARAWELVYKDEVVQRLWWSEKVPLLHLVRVELPAVGQQIDLAASGFGATPHGDLPTTRSRGTALTPTLCDRYDLRFLELSHRAGLPPVLHRGGNPAC